jgi:hypothetical protein
MREVKQPSYVKTLGSMGAIVVVSERPGDPSDPAHLARVEAIESSIATAMQ